MKRCIFQPFILLLLVSFALSSCAPLPPPGTPMSPDDRKAAQAGCIAAHTAGGALLGALAGAAIGGILGSWSAVGTAAAIGAAAGGVAGFAYAWGHCLSLYTEVESVQISDYSETAEKVKYQPDQGAVVKIEKSNLNPSPVAPGEAVNFGAQYYVLAPEGAKEIKVTECGTFFIKTPCGNKLLGSESREITTEPGGRTTNHTFEIPDKMEPGQYVFVFEVSYQDQKAKSEDELVIQMKQAYLPGSRDAAQVACLGNLEGCH